jgi:hypothetical protein
MAQNRGMACHVGFPEHSDDMKSGRGFLSIFDGLLDRVLCVLGALCFSQAPEFMQQYLQRLGGHLDEARRQLGVFENTAAQSGLSLQQFIQQTGANTDPAVARLGGVMNDAAERVSSLQSAHDALLHSALWERPFIFMRHLDVEIARATGAIFKPAVPTTTEGIAYALTGMLVALALYHLVVKRLVSLVKAPRAPARASG